MDILSKEFNISSSWLNSLKPFHFLIDSNLNINIAGDALSKVIPKELLGAKVHEIFSSNFELKDFELIKTYKDKLIILKSLSSDFNIYGSILISENNQYALFLTSLQLIDLDTLDNFNLSINDFPLSDTTVDHMISLQTAKSAAAENKALVKSLQKEKKRISAARNKLEHIFNSANVAILEVSFEEVGSDPWFTFMNGKVLGSNSQASELFELASIQDKELTLKDVFGSCDKKDFEDYEDILKTSKNTQKIPRATGHTSQSKELLYYGDYKHEVLP